MRGRLEVVEGCLNYIRGDRKDGADIFDFNKVIPYPKRYAPKADGVDHGGIGWCRDHWGTRWNAYEDRILVKTRRSVRIGFRTAWSPPPPVIRALSKKFPELEFTLKFWEGTLGFKGVLKVKGGKTLQEEFSLYRGDRGG